MRCRVTVVTTIFSVLCSWLASSWSVSLTVRSYYVIEIELVKSSEVTMRQSYDLGIVRWMFDDGILLRSELRLKLNVEVDGEVE